MSTYGKFEVIVYPSFYVVTNMQTHAWATKGTSDREKAHRWATLLMNGKPLPASALPEPGAEPPLEATPNPDAPDASELRDMDASAARARAERQQR